MLSIYVLTAIKKIDSFEHKKILCFFDSHSLQQREYNLESEGWFTSYEVVPASNGMLIEHTADGNKVIPLKE
jgi:hypothetical protein